MPKYADLPSSCFQTDNKKKDERMPELCDLSAVELRRRIGNREISPVELLDSCLARVAAVNPTLNAVVCVDEAGAREAADPAPGGGPPG